MRQRSIYEALLAVAAVLLAATSALAHHSFASEFDRDQPFEIEGSVSSIDWTNPHSWLHVDVEEDGETVTYSLELGAASILMRRGWRANSVMPGEKVAVTGFRARDRFNVGRASRITRENGDTVFGAALEE